MKETKHSSFSYILLLPNVASKPHQLFNVHWQQKLPPDLKHKSSYMEFITDQPLYKVIQFTL